MSGDAVSEKKLPVTFEDVSTAAYRIRNGVLRSPMSKASPMVAGGTELWLKHEHRQATGSFKERGALNTMLQLTDEQMKVGVIAASAGNHALALAHHGKRLNIPVTVVMPTFAPLAKVSRCRDLGATVHLHGANIQEARMHALTLMKENGMRYINGYDDPEIIAGAGTIGIEILEQVPDAEVVVIPIGGAGLIAGIALAVKKLRPNIKVIGVEPKNCDSYTQALVAGEPVSAATRPTLADGLNVPTVGVNAFEIGKKFVDKVITVDEKWIALAILRVLEGERMVVEGGGATGVAGIISGQLDEDLAGKKVVTVLCGSNVDVTVLGRVIERGLYVDGRLIQLTMPISDRPGGLLSLTSSFAELGANVMDITHERAYISDINIVSVHATLEVRDKEHRTALIAGLIERGFEPQLQGETPSIKDTSKLHSAGSDSITNSHTRSKL
eukprot:TRINITY_DN14742_c0_g1_i1.p1 TRINITY_DN14742_c0_g1~~TRINITY_DN14742_c0_g1_i1.p1  ORF type:complete len:442 (+),score=151.99 TRINITY_DN14742_c0_g1_i1:42-1367(+)